MKLLYIGDSRLARNIGARSTNIALLRLLETDFAGFTSIFRWYMEIDGLIPDTGKNEALFAQACPDDYAQLFAGIGESDAVLVQGEGSFLFSAPIRPDLAYLLLAFQICAQLGKPFFLVNAGISPPIDVASNGLAFAAPDREILRETLQWLRLARLVTVRDQYSYAFVKANDAGINIKYVPDALFSLFDFYQANGAYLGALLKKPQFALAHDRRESLIPKFDFAGNYVLLSGSAFAARYGGESKTERFAALAVALQQMLKQYNINLYLLEACDGDSFLRLQVSEATGIPYIPVTTNIFLLGRIIGSSRCLVSGRFHPSILAALGGAELVLMGSDSCKIQSLPHTLELGEREIFPPVPGPNAIERIVAETEKRITSPVAREKLRNTARKNGEEALRLPRLLQDCLKDMRQ